MNEIEKQALAQAIIELIKTHDGVRRAVMHYAFCSPNIRTVI